MVYKQTTPFTCGPSSYMEAFYKNKTKSFELRLHERGRIKPSKGFFGISFLEIDPNLYLFIDDKSQKIDLSFVKMVYKYEKMQGRFSLKELKRSLEKYYGFLLKKYKQNVEKLKGFNHVIDLLEKASKCRGKLLLLSHSKYWINNGPLHWICFKGKKEKKYLFSDSITGRIVRFSKEDLRKILTLVRKEKFPLQIVTDFS